MPAVFRSNGSPGKASRSGLTSSGTATRCSRPSCCGARKVKSSGGASPCSFATTIAGAQASPRPKPGRYIYAIEAWTDVYATWRREFLAKRTAGQDVGLDAQEGRELLASLKPPRTADMRAIKEACEKYDGGDQEALVADALAHCRRQGQAGRPHAQRYPSADRRPADRARRRLVRDGPAQPGPRLRASTAPSTIASLVLPEIAALGFDVLYLHADPSDRPHQPQRPQQCAARRARRSRQSLCDRLGGRRPRRHPPRARHARGFPPPGRGLRGARHGSRARFRRAMLARPSLAQGTSRVVQAPPRRLDPLRGEPAEEIRGHRQSRLLRHRQRAAMDGAARRRAVLARAGRAHLPRRQSAHQAVRVLGMADPRSSSRSTPTSSSSPKRSRARRS